MNGEIIECKYYEPDLLKSEFDFESNKKVLESINIDLRSATKYIREPASQIDLRSKASKLDRPTVSYLVDSNLSVKKYKDDKK